MVTDHLKAQQHLVEAVHDGTDAKERLLASSYDLLILDWELPGLSGIELCKLFRNQGGASPVLMLTARNDISDKELGFDTGADDYLTKPFELREFAARVKALLRRPEKMADKVITFGSLSLDTASHQLFRNGEEIELFPKEYVLVEFFFKNPNQLFTLEALQQKLWPSTSEASPETIRVHVARIRSKLHLEGGRPIIKTAFKSGYMFDTSAIE